MHLVFVARLRQRDFSLLTHSQHESATWLRALHNSRIHYILEIPRAFIIVGVQRKNLAAVFYI